MAVMPELFHHEKYGTVRERFLVQAAAPAGVSPA
jgi:hypothetical protein